MFFSFLNRSYFIKKKQLKGLQVSKIKMVKVILKLLNLGSAVDIPVVDMFVTEVAEQ